MHRGMTRLAVNQPKQGTALLPDYVRQRAPSIETFPGMSLDPLLTFGLWPPQ